MSFWKTLLTFILLDELFDCDDDSMSQSQSYNSLEYDEYEDFDDFYDDDLDDDF